MKILAIADRPPTQSIKTLLSTENIELIITLGDLDFFGLKELQNITSVPKIGVYGNHCSGNYFDDLGIHNMHLQTWEYQGMTFGGLEGCVRYKQNPEAIMYTQEEADRLLQNFPYVDVFLAHCPPYGVNDDPSEISHTGYTALSQYIELQHPKHLLHGHTYPTEKTLITEFKGTQIHYIYQEKIIDL